MASEEKSGSLEEADREEERASAARIWHGCWSDAGIGSAFLMASTFRSGSTRVAEALFFNGAPSMQEERLRDAWSCIQPQPDKALEAYLRPILATARDGRFGCKIMWPHLVYIARSMRLGHADAAALAALFGEARWVQVRREDKLAQAISFWRAKASGRWHVFRDEAEPALDYDFGAIRSCLYEIEMDDRLWDDFFARAGITPVPVTYERFDADPRGELRRILEGLGLAPPDTLNMENLLRRQRDTLSEQLRERFLADVWQGRLN